jgi:hypothetical protein
MSSCKKLLPKEGDEKVGNKVMEIFLGRLK